MNNEKHPHLYVNITAKGVKYSVNTSKEASAKSYCWWNHKKTSEIKYFKLLFWKQKHTCWFRRDNNFNRIQKDRINNPRNYSLIYFSATKILIKRQHKAIWCYCHDVFGLKRKRMKKILDFELELKGFWLM